MTNEGLNELELADYIATVEHGIAPEALAAARADPDYRKQMRSNRSAHDWLLLTDLDYRAKINDSLLKAIGADLPDPT